MSRWASAAWADPAPLAGRGGVDDGLQFPQGVSIAQGMRYLAVPVIGSPALLGSL